MKAAAAPPFSVRRLNVWEASQGSNRPILKFGFDHDARLVGPCPQIDRMTLLGEGPMIRVKCVHGDEWDDAAEIIESIETDCRLDGGEHLG